MVDENSEASYRNYQELHPETVMVAIIGSPEFHVDQIDRGTRTTDVDHLVKHTESFHTSFRVLGITGDQRQGILFRAEARLVSYLHACVVEGDEGGEQIQVAWGEHDGKQDLALPRDTLNKKNQAHLLFRWKVNHSHDQLQNDFTSSKDE